MKQLTGLDATFLYMETPETPMHVAGLTLFGVAIASVFGTKLTRDLALPFGPGLAAGVFLAFLLVRSPLAAG